MLKKAFVTVFALFLFFSFLMPVLAEENNKFGIHVLSVDRETLEKAAKLVNSNGGEWGYVTVIMTETDLDREKWQRAFDDMRELKLIPIVRLATSFENGSWKRPEKEKVGEWVEFLNSLNWVVKNRYIILFNEPNHATEWGGVVDPVDYAQTAVLFAEELKKKNKDFYLMPAALDLAAPNRPPNFVSADVFLSVMVKKIGKERFEELFDALASHSYPNPGFSAPATKKGRLSIQGYAWELSFLKRLGVTKDFPVFITETGWKKQGRLSEDLIAEYYRFAFEKVWLPDSRVKAVTPFVLTYYGEPFESFSWEDKDGRFFKFYGLIRSLPKVAGKPEIIDRAEIKAFLGKRLSSYSSYRFKIFLKNTGQKIWEPGDYSFRIVDEKGKDIKQDFDYLFSFIPKMKPFEEKIIFLDFNVKNKIGERKLKLEFFSKNKKITETESWEMEVIKPPSLVVLVKFFPKIIQPKKEKVEIQVFDKEDNLVFKHYPVEIINGEGRVEAVFNTELGEEYRVVVLRNYYLPRQRFIRFQEGENRINFRSMLPLDPNKDGKFELLDFLKGLFSFSQWRRLMPF